MKEKGEVVTGERDESWLRERYAAIPPENRSKYSFISMKLKRFRTFNRLNGRAAGDALVEQVYRVLTDWVGPEGYAAQISKGYYNLLLPFPRDYDELFRSIIELNRQIRDMDDPRFHGKVFSGFGVYQLTDEPVDFYTAQYNADICRTECPERTFRNSHFEVYGLTWQDAELRYDDLMEIINPALDRGDIKLYLQPKVDLRTGEIAGAEALMRWIDPQRGMIPVPDFLPMLEENGLIDNVDLHIFGQVCACINRWIAEYGRRIPVSVNLSANMFNYRYFFPEYQRVYEKYDTPRDLIEFELLESIVLNKVDRVRDVVGELTGFGFSCALDDFGSGFSSYSVLTEQGISTLKIDRSLFRDRDNGRERTIVRHIVQTARELGMHTVAEGVEGWDYVDYLREIGCDSIQGFVFYRPMPVEEFEARFVRGHEKISFEDREGALCSTKSPKASPCLTETGI